MDFITNVENFKCRLCLENESDLIYLFSEQGKQLNIQHILSLHFWFEIKDDDPVSKHVCSRCWLNVSSFHAYYSKILDIQNTSPFIISIKNETHGNNTSDGAIKKEDDVLATTNDVMKEEDNLFQVEGNSISEFSSNDFGNYDDTEMIDQDQLSTKSEENNDYEQENESDESEKKPTVKKTTRGKVLKSKKTKLITPKKKSEKTIDQEQILKEDQQIREFFIMVCDLCPVKFEKFQNVKAHYRVEHQIRGYLTCCNRKFYKRYCALEHMLRHIDPDSFRCKICNKSYSNRSGLKDHLDTHQPEIEKPYKCDKCPKAFVKKYQHDQHQIRHIPEEEKKFSCEICGKAFAKNSILQTHIRSVHEGAYVHICEICAKSFKSKMFYEQHCQVFHSAVAIPKVQCQVCGVWLKHEHSLRNHMRKHEEPDKDHICKICGKQSPNKAALRDHERYVHINERTHKCSICDKAFKRAIGLREHMATHTGEVLYTCPHCPKTFNSSANMHSHRKKIHPKEWAANRRNAHNNAPS